MAKPLPCAAAFNAAIPASIVAAESALYNPRLQLRYDVRDDIPVMLIDEATHLDQAEHERLMAVIAAADIQPTFVATS